MIQQLRQRLGDEGLSLVGRQVQDPQVLPVSARAVLLLQRIVGTPIRHARVQVLAIHVPGERSWFAHQPVDDVAVIDAMLRLTTQSLHRLHQRPRIPHLDHFGADTGFEPLTDQPRRHRVNVFLYLDRAPLTHTHPLALERVEPLLRQPAQLHLLVWKPLGATQVASGHQGTQELPVRLTGGKIATATQQQLLLQRLLEAAMTLLTIPVLMAAGGVGRLGRDLVVPQQRLIAGGVLLRIAVLVNRHTHAVGAMTVGDAAQMPQGVLQPFAQTGETLGKADGHILPVRVGQHEVIQQVRKRLAGDGDAQGIHVGEVRRAQPTGFVYLAEKDLLGRTVLGLPDADAAFDGATLALPVLAGILPLQPIDQGLGLQGGLALKQLEQTWPDDGQRVSAGTPRAWGGRLTGKTVLVAVLASGFAIHAGFHRCVLERCSSVEITAQFLDLRIGDGASSSHVATPFAEKLPVYATHTLQSLSKNSVGKDNCR